MRVERKDIEGAMAKLTEGKDLVYKLPETFGGEPSFDSVNALENFFDRNHAYHFGIKCL